MKPSSFRATNEKVARLRYAQMQRGFTLVELLVVIAIIGVLAGMITGISVWARQQAMKAKARSNISAIVTALEAYNTLNGVYPGAGVTGQAKDVPDQLFLALYTGNPKIGGSRDNHLGDWPAEAIGKWPGSFQDIYDLPTEMELDYTTSRTKCVFLDPWGHAYHYAEFDSRAPTDRVVSGNLKAKGGQSFAIWSDGPNRLNEWGKQDDVNSWSEGVGGGKTTSGGTK
jgi:prepilin-type N-terminal cleavage/methylation domain-containing protein